MKNIKNSLEVTITDIVSHDIYADNLILGKSLFFSLKLPANWDLAPGVSRPEIVASHNRQNKNWVATGNAWYVIYKPENRWALEFAITIRPNSKINDLTSKKISVGKHTANLQWKQKRRGLPWNRHDVTFMTIHFDCHYTERNIKLEFSGWCPREGFDEILEALKHLGCHSHSGKY